MDRQNCISGFLSELFRSCYEIHELANCFEKQSKMLIEISMNASVASVHVGNQARVFSEMANQISMISHALSQSIDRVHEFVGNMSHSILKSMNGCSQYEKFVRASSLLEAGENQCRVAEVGNEIRNKMGQLLSKTAIEFAYLNIERARLRHHLDRVWALIVSVKVSASLSQQGEDQFLVSIGDSLGGMASESEKLIEALISAMARFECSLESRSQDSQGELSAA